MILLTVSLSSIKKLEACSRGERSPCLHGQGIHVTASNRPGHTEEHTHALKFFIGTKQVPRKEKDSFDQNDFVCGL